MIKNYIIAAARSFSRNKLHTVINISGLATGLMAGILSIIFVLDELSYDKFHTQRDQIFRLNKINKGENGSQILTAETSGMMGPTMVDEMPEVINSTRYLSWFDEIVVTFNEKNITIPSRAAAFTDSTFFHIFDFNLIRGDRSSVLSRPQTMVLTESTAQSLFGSEDPIGKSIVGMNNQSFEITGIVQDPPLRSQLQFDALMSWTSTVPQMGSIPMEWMNNWIAQGINTYLLLESKQAASSVTPKLPKFMQDHLPTRVDKYELYLQAFNDTYLHSYNLQGVQAARIGNIQYIYLFSMIAGFILLIACINYINISTAKATRRSREVGMRKALGAAKRQLILQFMGESMLLTLLSVVIAFGLLHLAIPTFNELAGKDLSISLLLDFRVLAGVVVLALVVGLLSGIYPSLIISAFRPAYVLRGAATGQAGAQWGRSALITFQFIISIVMIAGTLLMHKQINFILSKDLGFDKEHILVVNLTPGIAAKKDVLQNAANNLPNVVSTSMGRTALGQGGASTYIIPEGFGPDEIEARMFPVDGNFLETYQIELKDGRFFQQGSAYDSGAVIINEALARRLNWNSSLEKMIRFSQEQPAQPVIGVLKDFNYGTLYREVDPLIMWVSRRAPTKLSVRFNGDPAPILGSLEQQWKQFEARYPFNYYFLDQAFATSYVSEQKLYKTVMTFAGLSIFIACLGLYGLVSFTIEQRTKEFGIRKILGASVASIGMLVNKKFALLVAIASVISVPILVPFMNQWLQKFAFRVDLEPSVFIYAIILTLFITVFAVSVQAIKVAMGNPAKALKQE